MDCNSLTVYNINNNKRYNLAIPKGDIEKEMKNNNFIFPEFLFDTPIVTDDTLVLNYFIEKYSKGKPLKYKRIIIDLKEYSILNRIDNRTCISSAFVLLSSVIPG